MSGVHGLGDTTVSFTERTENTRGDGLTWILKLFAGVYIRLNRFHVYLKAMFAFSLLYQDVLKFLTKSSRKGQ